MSKNFELMQQAGKAEEFQPGRKLEPVAATSFGNGGGYRAVDGMNLDQLAGEESLRLVQRIFLLQSQEPPHMVTFAGIDHGGGSSEICVRVAETLTKNISGTVCIVEANLRSPALPGMFGTTNHHGLTNALMTDGPIRSFARPVRGEKLWLLSSGALAVDSANLLNSKRLRTRLQELRKEFDFVLVDAPPLTRYADAIALGQLSDGFVLVLEANATRREAALKVSENLRAAQINVLGAVLNKRTFPIPESLYHKL
jgi:capsular exopolysaccharide synthesis family protein